MRSAFIMFAALAAATPAVAATFKSEAHDHTVAVFSSSKTLEHCSLLQEFSFMNDGERKKTQISCNIEVQPGNHLEVCQVTHELVVEPKLVGPVKIDKCEPGPKPGAAIQKK